MIGGVPESPLLDRPETPAGRELDRALVEPASTQWPATDPPLFGYGQSMAHHGEILQGVFEGPDGLPHRGLVTLPCQTLRSFAIFAAEAGAGLRVEPSWRVKALRAARLTLDLLEQHDVGGQLTIRANIPVRWGLGSSTSDVLAAIRAIAYAFETRLQPKVVAEIAVRSEVASDSLMFEDRAVLFAQRDGLVLEDFSRELPPIDVLGFNADGTGNGVDTLLLPPAEYSWWEVQAFRPLVGLLRRAIHDQDARLLGQVASASARINQRYLAKPRFDAIERLVEESGAVGLQVAHSGSVLGFLFDALAHDKDGQIELAHARLGELGFPWIWHFTNHPPRWLAQPRSVL